MELIFSLNRPVFPIMIFPCSHALLIHRLDIHLMYFVSLRFRSFTRVYMHISMIIRFTNSVIWAYYNMSVSQPLLIMLVYNAVDMRHKSGGNITPELR